MFYDMLRTCGGEVVEVVTTTERLKGTILSVVDDVMIMGITNPNLHTQEEVTIRIDAISYIRFFHGN